MLFTLGSLGCWFEREIAGTSSSQILGPINPTSLPQHSKAWDHTTSNLPKGLTQIHLHQPQSNNQGPRHVHAIPANKFHRAKIQAKFSHPHSLSEEDQQMTIQAKTHTMRHLQALDTPTLYPAACPLQ